MSGIRKRLVSGWGQLPHNVIAVARPGTLKDPKVTGVTQSAEGLAIPLAYGECQVSGRLFVSPMQHPATGGLVLALGFCMGPIQAYKKLAIASEELVYNVPNGSDQTPLSNGMHTAQNGVIYELFSGGMGQQPSVILNQTFPGSYPTAYPYAHHFMAYVVLHIPPKSKAWGGLPDVQATIEGLTTVLNYQTQSRAYTTNPALIAADLYTRWSRGGVSIAACNEASVSAAANECGTLIDGTPRREVHPYISTQQPLSKAISDVCAQAMLYEMWSNGKWGLGFDKDSASVATITGRRATTSDIFIAADGDGIGILQADESPLDVDSRPTVVRVRFPDRVLDGEESERIATLAGVRDGLVQWRETEFSAGWVRDGNVAQRLADDILAEATAGIITKLTVSPRGGLLQRGDRVLVKNALSAGSDFSLTETWNGTLSGLSVVDGALTII